MYLYNGMWYNISMKDRYTRKQTCVYMINYHFVFCPRYRRKIFDIESVEERFKELVEERCKKDGIEIIAMECDRDHAHLFLACTPIQSPAWVMKEIKECTGRTLRQEIEKLFRMPNLWTRSYFVSTAGEVSSETIKRYVETQKTKYV